MSRRFFQIRLSQWLLLFVLVSVNIALFATYYQRMSLGPPSKKAASRFQQAQEELNQAVRSKNITLAKHALAAGFPVRELIDGKNALFHLSVATGQVEMVELLLRAGADVNHVARTPPTSDGRYRQLLTASWSHPPLFDAIGIQQPAEVRLKLIQLLIECGADPLKKMDEYNAMDMAVHTKDGEVGQLLGKSGVPYGLREMASFNRLDEIKRAVNENPEVVKQQVEDSHMKRRWRCTLLSIALRHGYREMSLYLMEAGSPLDSLGDFGESLLHNAVTGGDPQLIRELVARGIDINSRSENGSTPIMWAVRSGNLKIVATLIECGADVRGKDDIGRSVLFSAALANHPELFQPLLKAGADATEAGESLREEANEQRYANQHKEHVNKMARLIEELSDELRRADGR